MDKIQPALSQYRRNKDGVASRWITTQNPELMAEFGYEVRQLYTREALEAVAKAVQKAAFGVAWNDNDRREIKQLDIAAIINQLTGE